MDFFESKSIYLQIADHLIDQILSGERVAGDRMASVRELAAALEVNANTVVKTYSFLTDLSLIKMQRGVGYFVTDEAPEKAKLYRKEELLNEDVPRLLQKLKPLGLSIDDLLKEYHAKN